MNEKSSKRKKLAIVILAELLAGAFLCFTILQTVEYQNRAVRQEAEAERAAEYFNQQTIAVVPASSETLEVEGEEIVRGAWIDQIRTAAENLEFVSVERDYDIENSEVYQIVQEANNWNGARLSKGRGTVTGPNGKETYYNLNMSVIVRMMRSRGYYGPYWVRSDGVKMYGNYVMVAANLNRHPRGSIVRSSVGLAIVCDTGGFAKNNPNQLDIAAAW